MRVDPREKASSAVGPRRLCEGGECGVSVVEKGVADMVSVAQEGLTILVASYDSRLGQVEFVAAVITGLQCGGSDGR